VIARSLVNALSTAHQHGASEEEAYTYVAGKSIPSPHQTMKDILESIEPLLINDLKKYNVFQKQFVFLGELMISYIEFLENFEQGQSDGKPFRRIPDDSQPYFAHELPAIQEIIKKLVINIQKKIIERNLIRPLPHELEKMEHAPTLSARLKALNAAYSLLSQENNDPTNIEFLRFVMQEASLAGFDYNDDAGLTPDQKEQRHILLALAGAEPKKSQANPAGSLVQYRFDVQEFARNVAAKIDTYTGYGELVKELPMSDKNMFGRRAKHGKFISLEFVDNLLQEEVDLSEKINGQGRKEFFRDTASLEFIEAVVQRLPESAGNAAMRRKLVEIVQAFFLKTTLLPNREFKKFKDIKEPNLFFQKLALTKTEDPVEMNQEEEQKLNEKIFGIFRQLLSQRDEQHSDLFSLQQMIQHFLLHGVDWHHERHGRHFLKSQPIKPDMRQEDITTLVDSLLREPDERLEKTLEYRAQRSVPIGIGERSWLKESANMWSNQKIVKDALIINHSLLW